MAGGVERKKDKLPLWGQVRGVYPVKLMGAGVEPYIFRDLLIFGRAIQQRPMKFD
jgi:preprotein translocase subunit SecY